MMSETVATKNTGSLKNKVCWILTVLLPLIIMLCLPTGEVMTVQVKLYLSITAVAIIAFCFEHIPMAVAAILLPVFYTVFKVAPAATCFTSWSNHLPWLILGGLVFSNVLVNVGLAKRIAYKCILLTGCSYAGILWGICFTSIILAVVIPGNVAFPLLALTYGICKALGFGPSKESAGIMMTGVICSSTSWCYSLHPNTLVMFGTAESITGPINLAWFDYIKYNWPSILFMFLIVFIMTKMFKPDTPFQNKEYFQTEYSSMGKLSVKEKKATIISVLLFASIFTANWHGIAIGWCFLFFSMLFFIPGIDVGTDELKTVNFAFVIFIASCMTIGNVGASLGLGDAIANLAGPMLAGKSATFILMFAWLICVLVNFLMTPMAMVAAFAVPFSQIALTTGINVIAMYYAMINGMGQLVLPYEFADYLLFYSMGLIPLKEFSKITGIKMALNLVFMLVILIPYWKLIGLI